MTTIPAQVRPEASGSAAVSSESSDAPEVGSAGRRNNEKIITFSPSQREKVIMNDDSYIVLGGDRISTPASGYAGKGHTGCHMIDLVVGRDPLMSGHPSFKGDAARIYICQRTDVDHSFGLSQGNVLSPKTRSAIGMKADGVRIVARDGIKLVTMGRGTKNSLNNKVQTVAGIDLIAGNDDKGLEPIAKAYKVKDAFGKVASAIEGLSAMVENFIDIQAQYNRAMAYHTHPSAPLGPPSMPITMFGTATSTYAQFGARIMALSKMPMRSHRLSLVQLRVQHLTPLTSGWIGSRYNMSN